MDTEMIKKQTSLAIALLSNVVDMINQNHLEKTNVNIILKEKLAEKAKKEEPKENPLKKKSIFKNKRVIRHWSKQEDEVLLGQLEHRTKTIIVLSKELNRTPSAINMRFITLRKDMEESNNKLKIAAK